MSPYKVRGFQFMFRKRLVATVAAAPLLVFAGQASAAVTIATARTAPVLTSTVDSGAAADIIISNAGSVKVAATGPIITVNTNNNVTNGGTIASKDQDGSIGILVNGGVTTNVTNNAVIEIIDGFDQGASANNTDGDADLDGAFATGTGRYGIRVTGAGAVTGSITNSLGAQITVEGNNSWGISVESALNGNFSNAGSITVVGTNNYGIQITAPVTGTVNVAGAISATGQNAVGAALDADVTGLVNIQGVITATGYRYPRRSNDPAVRDDFDADDLLQGGSALRITGNAAGGVLLAVAPTADLDNDNDGWTDAADTDDDNDGVLDTTDTDDDGDGITDDDYDSDGTANGSDTDDDNDGILDADDPDDDGDGFMDGDSDLDGLIDTAEAAAAVSVQGASPALLIGSNSQATTLGLVGAGANAYGLIIHGSVTAEGVYDDIDATAIRIGGQSTLVQGGMFIDGTVSAVAFNGKAQAIHLASGANVDSLVFGGTIYAGTASTSAPLATEDSVFAVAVRIDAGASATSLINSGAINAFVNGERSDAIAVYDGGGHINFVQNTGTISALISPSDDVDDSDDTDADPSNETILGNAIALDLHNALGGVHIVQYGITGDLDGDGVGDGVDGDVDGDGVGNASDTDDDNDGILDTNDTTNGLDTDGDGVADSKEPVILGDILLGGGADVIDLQNGLISGDVSFGAGADVLNVGTAAWAAAMSSAISDSDGQLTINVVNGTLALQNTNTLDATSLSVTADGTLIVTADPDTDSATQIQVATANLATGAQLGLQLGGLITGPEQYVIIKTDTPAGLTIGTLDQSLLGDAPYLVVAQASASTALGEVYLDVRRRTVAEIGLTGSEALAFDAVYAALNGDTQVRDAFLGASSREEFMALYEQMLPDQGEGVFSSLDAVTKTISRLTGTKPDLHQRYGPDSFWMQEVNVQVMREAGTVLGSETKAFGFVGGYESMGADGGALGATLAFVSAEEKDDVAKIGEETSVSLLEAGIYWRRSTGPWMLSARGSGGYAWFDGDRVFISPSDGLIRQADSGWNGFTGAANISASYEAGMGRFYIRPAASIDYLYLSEGERRETGGGAAYNLTLQERTSSRLTATAELAFGATFGRELWWRPEVRFGYRQHLAGEIGDTVFSFTGGAPVALPASVAGDGAVIIGLSLRAGTPMSYVAMEGEYEAADGEDRYNLQLAGRMMF